MTNSNDYKDQRLHEALREAGREWRENDPGVPDGFEQRLHRRLAESPQTRPARPVWFKAALTMAALCLVIGGAWLMQEQSTKPSAPAALAVPLGQTAVLEIAFDADEPIESASFLITLPDGLGFVSDDPSIADTREIEWEGDLTAGRNAFPVMVEGLQTGIWTLRAQLRRDDSIQTREIPLQVAPDPQG